MNYQEFISKEKSLLIAPAGYGKTHALAECLSYCSDSGIQLVITHTHAGIASLKEKIKNLGINSKKYHLETITGFAQKYVIAFYCQTDIPDRENTQEYYPFILEKAIDLFKYEPIKRIVQSSYTGLFVDEYQDCTITQHRFISELSAILPTHILGDPMQGIFGFRESLVNFETDLSQFERIGQLNFPWRWYKDGNNAELGDELKCIRDILESKQKSIKLNSYNEIETITITESDIYQNRSTYMNKLSDIILNRNNYPELSSLLILLPEYFDNGIPRGKIGERSKIKARIDFSNQLTLLEAIDNKDYYALSKTIDDLILNIGNKRKKIKCINQNLLSKLFNKGSIDEWINEDHIINKRPPLDKSSKKLGLLFNIFISNPSVPGIQSIIKFLKYDLKFKTKRNDLLFSLIKSMSISITENKSVYESMISHKNIIRRIGKKIHGKCLGTTLLTKGLEFDTVVILNAHRIDDYKHFYVAITRGSKRLIIFTERQHLDFHN